MARDDCHCYPHDGDGAKLRRPGTCRFDARDACPDTAAVLPSLPSNTMSSSEIRIRFVSSNGYKIKEANDILGPRGITVVGSDVKIEELQTTDAARLVRDKVLKAFTAIGRPLFVEHTGLYVHDAGQLPGGLT